MIEEVLAGGPVNEADAPYESNFFAAEAAPAVTANPIAKAVSEVGVKADSTHPVAASFPSGDEAVNVQVTGIEPIDATAPAAPAVGTPEVAQHDASGSKGRKKK